MNFQLFILGCVLSSSVKALRIFPSKQAVVVKEVALHNQGPIQISPSALLELSRPQPHFYTAAMIEIKRLEEKPICHRMAAQLLMKNCQDMKDLDVHEYQIASDKMQRNHVETFAASLALCDMERAKFDVPSACAPFRRSAIEDAIRDSGKLKAAEKDIERCLAGLGQDHSHWSTWLSYRDTSLLLCRGASIDSGKDQAIAFHKSFVEMMEHFTTALYDDLHDLRREMAQTSRDLNVNLKDTVDQVKDWVFRTKEGFDSVKANIQDVDHVVESIRSGAKDASRIMQVIVNTGVQGAAAVAAEQERAVATFEHRVTSGLRNVDDLVKGNTDGLQQIREMLGATLRTLDVVSIKQDNMQKESTRTLNVLKNATQYAQAHEYRLADASVKAGQISATLDQAAASVVALSSVSITNDRIISVLAPITTLSLGSLFMTPSLGNNILLVIIGFSLGEGLKSAIHLYKSLQECYLTWAQVVQVVKPVLTSGRNMRSQYSDKQATVSAAGGTILEPSTTDDDYSGVA